MKRIFFLFLFFICLVAYAQQAYYKGIDFSLPSEQLYQALQEKLEDYKASYTYGAARDMMKVTDGWEEDSSKVTLIYGFNDQDNDCTTDYTRDKTSWEDSPANTIENTYLQKAWPSHQWDKVTT